jgi:hypothetical protein
MKSEAHIHKFSTKIKKMVRVCVKERVELYIYSPSGALWAVLGVLYLHLYPFMVSHHKSMVMKLGRFSPCSHTESLSELPATDHTCTGNNMTNTRCK